MRIQQLLTLSALGVVCARRKPYAREPRCRGEFCQWPTAAVACNFLVQKWRCGSDKYVYQAGQNLTLKWTVKTNGDLIPTRSSFIVRTTRPARDLLPGGAETATISTATLRRKASNQRN